MCLVANSVVSNGIISDSKYVKEEEMVLDDNRFDQYPYSHVLTPSPDDDCGAIAPGKPQQPQKKRYIPVPLKSTPPGMINRFSTTKSPTEWPHSNTSGIDSTSTLTPPTPNDPHHAHDDRVHDADDDSRKSIYESAEEQAQSGIYAPVFGIPRGGAMDDMNQKPDFYPVYKPSWKEGSKSYLFKEQLNRKKQRITVRITPSQPPQQPPTPMRQPHTPGSTVSHQGPRTPGAMTGPGTPSHGAPQTPGNPNTPGYANPSTPGMGGGPPSVGPHTPYAHTPGSIRQPHTPGQGGTNIRSPSQAVAPSPSMGKDFNAPKTPRTPRTPRSALTPGKGGPGSAGIRGVSSLPEASALLLSLILGDSVLDAHRDRNFVQAPLCICRNDVVGSDGHLLGTLYLKGCFDKFYTF